MLHGDSGSGCPPSSIAWANRGMTTWVSARGVESGIGIMWNVLSRSFHIALRISVKGSDWCAMNENAWGRGSGVYIVAGHVEGQIRGAE